jgi:glucose/mannose-6-phosphate isomerase
VTDGAARMRSLAEGLPEQIERGWQRQGSLQLPFGRSDVHAVAVAGMGGSAIGADLVAAVLEDLLAVPLVTVRDSALPAWVDGRTLLVASSYSGNTEETLHAFEEADRRGARRVAVTSGGALAERAAGRGVPLVGLPAGLPPRAALGWSLTALSGVLRAAGLMADPTAALRSAARAMRRLVVEEQSGGESRAGRVADLLVDRVPVIVAPEGLGAVARRWKTQLNENAKVTAAWDTLPELAHNSVEGYGAPAAVRNSTATVLLRGSGARGHAGVVAVAVTHALRGAGLPFVDVEAPPDTPAAEALWLLQLGDLVSLELAERNGVDPLPVAAIERLKAALAGRSG